MVRMTVELESDFVLGGLAVDPLLSEDEADHAFLCKVFLAPAGVGRGTVWLLNCLSHWDSYIDILPTSIAMSITVQPIHIA